MKHKRFKFCAILLVGLSLTGVQAQQSINVSGGNALGDGGTVSYSVGQLACQTHSDTTGFVMEGVQQPYEVSVVNTIIQAGSKNFSVSIYPNPTTGYLTLSIDEFENSNLSYQLYNIQGQLLQRNKITGSRTDIHIGNLENTIYLVRIIQNNKEIKTYKIIKTHKK